jgi:hypothetical protein
VVPAWTSADRTARDAPRLPPFRAAAAGVDGLDRDGEPAQLRALRVSPHEGFDRVVFEFHERVPSFHVDYVDGPASGCRPGPADPVAGGTWLEVRFHPASADAAIAEFVATGRDPTLGVIREIERTCDTGGVVTWVIGSASLNRFRALELTEPPRIVVDIEH